MQNAGAVLAALCERGRKTFRSRHKSLESPVHRKVPAGFGGRLRGKGPQRERDLAAQPILLDGVHGKHPAQMLLTKDQHSVGELSPDGQSVHRSRLQPHVRPWRLTYAPPGR